MVSFLPMYLIPCLPQLPKYATKPRVGRSAKWIKMEHYFVIIIIRSAEKQCKQK